MTLGSGRYCLAPQISQTLSEDRDTFVGGCRGGGGTDLAPRRHWHRRLPACLPSKGHLNPKALEAGPPPWNWAWGGARGDQGGMGSGWSAGPMGAGCSTFGNCKAAGSPSSALLGALYTMETGKRCRSGVFLFLK